MGTVVVGVVVFGVVGFSAYTLVKNKRRGKSIQCGQDCKHCGGGCH
ncbi:MAG: FeoB-associated Cys-rich membrane protein [Clostridiales bacterium]|nr:FeoB-associated Cys-rich membrane protein [Clostridium sp. N3C]NLZ47786.1 FeoB-associated Cys-rich membrane protein [Clostridiales bacterium]SCN24919.1 Virus attachment protein p12 family protein [Clostridium sp. N3C]